MQLRMNTSPATPGSSGATASNQPSIARDNMVAAVAHEPSPASTYGPSTVGNSVPATPDEINDPAIVAQSIRTSGSSISRLNGAEGIRGLVSTPSHSSLVKTGKSRAPHSATGESTVSSPTSDRAKEILQAATWRGDGENFVKGHTDKADVFFEPNAANGCTNSSAGPWRAATIIKGVVVTNDNAQALLPPMACVFVANLSSTRSDEQLEFSVASVFEQFGRVYVKIRRDPKGMPYAFAQYENVADSERAIEQGRGIIIDGRQCRTERAKAHRSLYLSRITGGLITEQEAYEILKELGPLEKVWIASPTDKEMYRLPDGIWIMWSYFQGARDAQNAFKDHPKYRLEEPSLPESLKARAERLVSPTARMTPGLTYDSPQLRMWRAPDRSSLYVGGLPHTVTQAQLIGLFQGYGRIRGIEIISKPINSAVGICVFAFVELGSEEEARRAAAQEYTLEGLRLRVEIKHAPVQVPSRGNYMPSAGSPRRRQASASPEALGGMTNSTLAMGRALAAGVHPAIVSFIFASPNTPQTFNTSSRIGTQSAVVPPTFGQGPLYAQVPFESSYYPAQYGPYGSPTAPTEADGTHNHYQYPPVAYHTYPVLSPYVYSQSNEDAHEASSATVRGDLH